jgi:tryptophan synthase alpha chain
MAAATANNIDPIFILAPTSSSERISYLARFGRGFFYCVARKGVTGAKTDFSSELDEFLDRRGKVEIAVVGSQALRLLNTNGIKAVGDFFGKLR